jgi:glycosyltransferase involved in cell wall biosynthesis
LEAQVSQRLMAVNPAAAVETPHRLHVTHGRDVHPRDVRIVFLTNIIAPYWKSIFDALSPRYSHMRVLLSTRMEPNRHWEADWKGLDVVVQKTITLKRHWRHTSGFTEPIYLHLPLDTVKQLRSFSAQLVISSEMGFRTLLALVYRKMHPNSRLVVWAEIAESTEHGRGRLRVVLRRFLHRYVDGFVVPGESGARYLRRVGTHYRKIFRVPYTTDVDRFAASPLARREDNARSLLYVGQLIERKGLLPFISVLSKWAGANPGRVIQFVLAGDGPLRNQLERGSVPPNLKLGFLGNVAYRDLPNLYAEAGIFVFPTLADTWGVVVNEALASGLPVLGSVRSQAVEELVEDGRNGWLFQPDKTEQMYNAIDRSLSTSVTTLNTMRRHARATALQLRPDYVADRVDAILAHMTRTS